MQAVRSAVKKHDALKLNKNQVTQWKI